MAQLNNKKRSLSIRLPLELYYLCKSHCRQNGVTLNTLCMLALKHYITYLNESTPLINELEFDSGESYQSIHAREVSE